MMKRKLTRPFLALAILTSAVSAQAADRLLILAPSDLHSDWQWYAAQRKKNHPEIEFEVVNTQTIYNQYKYRDVRCPPEGPRTNIGANECRYPSESIYKWLQDYYNQHPNLKYLVLGGAWLDVTDPVVHYHQDGTEINLDNAIPSMRVKPNIKGDGFYNPTDMYYACLSKKTGETGHHWDPNDNGIYLEGNHDLSSGEESHTKGWADIAVSRMTMKPIVMDASVEFNPEFELVGGQRVLNQHQLITNFLYKVNRAEGKGVVGRRTVNNQIVWDLAENEDQASRFSGRNKLAITSTYLQNKACGLDDPKMLRDENEFFDGAPNMYAPEHPSRWEDTGPHMRRHVSEVAALNRPVLETVSYHANNIYSKNAVGSAFSGAFNSYDREIGAVNGHGWAGGTGWFSAKTFSTCKGLTKINVVGISCETAYLDIYGNQNGKSVANLSLGESGMANVTKTGGVIASINNSRYGWVNWEVEQLFGHNQSWRLHYWFYDGITRGLNAGSAWLRMQNNYYNDFKYDQMPPAIPGQCYTQMMLFGDPLIAVVQEQPANAVMEYAVPSGVTKLERAGNLLKIMRGMTIAGNKLEIGLNGGVGGVGTYQTNGGSENSPPNEPANAKRPNGIKFTGEPGELVFNNTSDDAYFFVNKVENAKKITFAGAGAIVNTDKFAPETQLAFEGQADLVGKTARPNVIRANLDKTTGALARYLPLELSNTSLQFETYDAFAGYAGADFATLDDSKLCFRVSRWRGLGDYPETIRGNLTLNSSILAADYPAVINLAAPTITVSGASAIETTHGGTFRLNGTTNVVLANGATLTLDAEFVAPNGSAALNFSGSGRVIVKNPKGLIGNVNFASGVDLELGDLPLSNVSSLTLAAGNKLILKKDGTFYQLLPMAGALQVGEGVSVFLKDGESETELDAEISPTGAIFQTGSISSWTKVEGVWEGAEKYFPDIEGGVSTVNVEKNVAVSSLFFANKATTYTFQAATGATPTLTFDSLSIGGATRFLIPSVFNARLFIASGDFVGSAVTSPVVEIGAGGSYESERTNGTTLRVQKDGTLVLSGEHALTLEFAEGAIVKATNGAALSWTDQTSVLWPESGKVIVDARDFTATSDLKPIISGVRADMAFLRHLEVRGENVSLALNEKGDVCLVAIESADENWLRDEVVEITETPKTMTIGSAKRTATLTYKTSLENAVLNLIVDGGSLLTDELHFEGFARVNLVNVKLGTGTLYAAPETHIAGDSSGRLSIGGNDTVYLESPTDPWSLAEGIQGMIYVGITDRARAERQQVFTIAANEDWPIGGLSAVAYDPASAEVNDAFAFVREDTAVYLVPPGIRGTVSSAGETRWSDLQWIAYDENPVEIRDWHNVYTVEIVSANDAAVVVMDGAPKMKLVTSGSKLTLKADADAAITLPSEIVFNNELAIQGAILPSLDFVKGRGKLVLDTGDITEIVIPGNIMPIEAAVEIRKGSTLRLAHQTYFQNKAADFTFISGRGTLEIKDVSPKGARFFMPDNRLMFSQDLTFKLETELELQRCHCTDKVPLEVGNLTGSGKWGYGLMSPDTMLVDMGMFMANNPHLGLDKWRAVNCGTRVLKTIQSDVSEWTGWLPDWYGATAFEINFNEKLVVSGSENTPSLERRLVYSGKAADTASLSCTGDKGANHDVTIESSGCFELNGYWNGNVQNNGILVIGQKCVIKNDKTKFSGSGKIATMGGQINLISNSALKDYKLNADTYGEIFFTAAQGFGFEQQIMSAEEYDPKEELILVAEKDGVRQWQRATAANFKDGKLMWLGEGGKETKSNIELEIEGDKKGFFDLITDDKYLGGATSVTLSGVSTEASVLDATSDLGQYKGIVNLSNVTVKSVSPIETKLGKNPVGKLIFVVDDPEHESELMGLETGFTYDPTQFSVEIVDNDGNQVETYWTWTVQNGALKYVLTDPKSNLYMPRAFKFDGDLSSWGTNGQNLGTINADNFVRSRGGNALTGHNQYGDGFEIGGKDWTVSWSARLSPVENAVHVALGTKSGGGFTLTTVNENRVAISRWLGNQAAIKLIEADVPFATKRFNSYILTYRNGYYTLYVNGEKVGETKKDVDGATKYPNSINWQFFSIHGGNVGATDYGTAGAIDDWRLYTVALGEEMIKAIAAEFSPWPEFGKPDENGEIWIDVDEVDGQIFVEGTNTYHLTSSKAGTSVARFVSRTGTPKIIIEDGVELVVDMSSTNRTPLSAHQVEIKKGGRLVLRQTDNMVDLNKNLSGAILSNIKGTGTIEFRSDNLQYTLKMASSRKASATMERMYWDENLSVCINTTVQLVSNYGSSTPLVLRNLSGNGTFVQEGGNSGEARYIEVVQTEKTVFTGSIPAGTTLTVVGEGNAPNAETPLVFSPKTALKSNNTIKISSNAALAITNSDSVKNATIINDGLLVLEPAVNETLDLTGFKFGGESPLQQIAMTGEGTVILPIGNAIFMLASNPTGTLKIPAGSNVVEGQYIMTLALGATIDPAVFKLVIADSQRTAIPYADGNELKFRFRVSPPKILFR